MNFMVQKYGGTSVGDINSIKNVANRIITKKKQGFKMIVVVSAMGDNTDKLMKLAYALSDNPPKREVDMLISTGEQVSIALLSMALNALGYHAISLTGAQVGIKTVGKHMKSRITDIDDNIILKYLKEDKIVIIAGFQGVNHNDDITTLGRGGSDTSAVAIASKLQCPCEIYTDVDGIYSLDPRIYPDAKKLDSISYEEMLEMASLGAGVMHARAIEIGQKYKIPITVASSTKDKQGTTIKESDKTMESTVVTGLAIDNNDAMITLNDVPYNIQITAEIFKNLANNDINIDMISQTSPKKNNVDISFTVPKNELDEAMEILSLYSRKYSGISLGVKENISKLSVVGIGMRGQSGVAAQIFVLLAKNKIEVDMVTTSEIKISYVIKAEDQKLAIKAIAQEFQL
ncbi:MAG: aspartate kinase [Eubacteriales bacterium]